MELRSRDEARTPALMKDASSEPFQNQEKDEIGYTSIASLLASTSAALQELSIEGCMNSRSSNNEFRTDMVGFCACAPLQEEDTRAPAVISRPSHLSYLDPYDEDDMSVPDEGIRTQKKSQVMPVFPQLSIPNKKSEGVRKAREVVM